MRYRHADRGWFARLAPAALALCALVAGPAAAQQTPFPTVEDAEEEELRRYTVEVILFLYDASVSSGTEIFIPEAPPAPEPPADPFADPFADRGADPFADPFANPQATDSASAIDISRDRDASLATPGPTDAGDEDVIEYGDLLPPIAVDESLLDAELEPILGADSVELRVLSPEELTMIDIHERLILLDAYRPVLWSGWTQVVREEAETPAVRLRRLGNVPLELDGELKLYLSRFLHLVVDLNLESRDTTFDPAPVAYGDGRMDFGYPGGSTFGYASAPMLIYRISEDRILRSDEIRYFDHPKFGMLAKLTRVKESELPDAEGADPTVGAPAASGAGNLPPQ